MSEDHPDRVMPERLQELNAIPVDYADGEGIDFEPYAEFMAADETSEWLRAWTGNETVAGDDYLIFGQDGTGGYAAFWQASDNVPILECPVVFFGSEGEVGVVARDFSDYLWLLAGGVGPYEAVTDPGFDRPPVGEFLAFAQRHAGNALKSPAQVVADAQSAFPYFTARIEQLIR